MNFKFIFLNCVFVLITTVTANYKSYTNYKLYKVVPKDDSDVKILKEIQSNGVGEFWREDFKANDNVQVMVAPENREKFFQYLGNRNFETKEIIKDIQKVIDDQLKPNITKNSVTESYLSYSWTEYHNLEAIYKWLDELAENHPNVVKTVVMGKSLENRDIKGIIIDYHPERANRSIGVFEGTLHAREWIATAVVTWIAKEFLTSNDPEIRALAENFEWHIFPVVNPDGYAYTFTHNRMWRKNRSPANVTNCPAGIDDDMSHGVDLNRNFDFEWNTVGASNDPCSNLFAGPGPASEPETRVIAQYVLNLNEKGNILYYFAMHSFTQLIVIPYSHVESDGALLSGNYGDMYEVAIRGSDAMRKRYGTEYTPGLSANVLYPMSGTSFDWVKYATNVPISYLIELRDYGEYGFLLPTEQIIPNSLEFMDGLIEMDKTTRRMGYYSSGSENIFYSSFAVILSVFIVLFQ